MTICGTTAILVVNTSIDIVLHDTHYVIEHFHLVVSLRTITSLQLTVLQHNRYYTSDT